MNGKVLHSIIVNRYLHSECAMQTNSYRYLITKPLTNNLYKPSIIPVLFILNYSWTYLGMQFRGI